MSVTHLCALSAVCYRYRGQRINKNTNNDELRRQLIPRSAFEIKRIEAGRRGKSKQNVRFKPNTKHDQKSVQFERIQ